MTERDRMLAYIAAELARDDRDPADVRLLERRRAELLRPARRGRSGLA